MRVGIIKGKGKAVKKNGGIVEKSSFEPGQARIRTCFCENKWKENYMDGANFC